MASTKIGAKLTDFIRKLLVTWLGFFSVLLNILVGLGFDRKLIRFSIITIFFVQFCSFKNAQCPLILFN